MMHGWAAAFVTIGAGIAACAGADPIDDPDGDGVAWIDGDCDDLDMTIHRGAEDVPGDGVDSDCNGTDLVPLPVAPWVPSTIDTRRSHDYHLGIDVFCGGDLHGDGSGDIASYANRVGSRPNAVYSTPRFNLRSRPTSEQTFVGWSDKAWATGASIYGIVRPTGLRRFGTRRHPRWPWCTLGPCERANRSLWACRCGEIRHEMVVAKKGEQR